ncbi:hypothetical protein [Woodsholea maritima]|uniref:hypothetical protein n=1 Tax=Woodsholea maritima TaxID=240237 RepID=UPI00036E1139|nr:hypothetical protein [Woodsholea maritima]
MEYTLALDIAPADLDVIKNAGQKITLMKRTSNSSANVIWLTIDPFQSNTVQWQEDYWMYASNTVYANGSTISKLSETSPGPAQDGMMYTFANNNFSEPAKAPDVPSGTFAAVNQVSYQQYPSLIFGLAQSAMVNELPVDRKPISARPVLSTQHVAITPYTIVDVFLQGHFESETIITNVIGSLASARFGGSVNTIRMTYSPTVGVFVQR